MAEYEKPAALARGGLSKAVRLFSERLNNSPSLDLEQRAARYPYLTAQVAVGL
jgi:hypothetical protein